MKAKNNYKKLKDISGVIGALHMQVKITANKYIIESNKYLEKCQELLPILDHYGYNNNMINKPKRKVFFAIKEFFSSTFNAFNIAPNDYIVGYLPNTQCNMISYKENVIENLKILENKYNIEYWALNPHTNECNQLEITHHNRINNIQMFEIDIKKLYDLYIECKMRYMFYVGMANLSLYKIPRIDTASHNIEDKILKTKQFINKQINAQKNKSIYQYEGVNNE